MAEIDLTDQIQILQQRMQDTKIPGIAGTLIGNQRINVHVGISDTEQIIIGIITEDKTVKSIAVAEVKDPTLDVYTTLKTVQKIIKAENSLGQLKKSISGKEITYTAHGALNTVKFNSALILFKWFGPNPEAEEETVVENETVASESIEEPTIEETPVVEEINETVSAPPTEERETVHTMPLVGVGFPENVFTIKVGDTIEWKNEREGLRYDKAMIVGTRLCSRVKSPLYSIGESYKYTFTQKGTCLIVDGVYTTEILKLTIE